VVNEKYKLKGPEIFMISGTLSFSRNSFYFLFGLNELDFNEAYAGPKVRKDLAVIAKNNIATVILFALFYLMALTGAKS